MNFLKTNSTNLMIGVVIILLLVLVSRNEPLTYYGTQRAMSEADYSVDHTRELKDLEKRLIQIENYVDEIANNANNIYDEVNAIHNDVEYIRIWQ